MGILSDARGIIRMFIRLSQEEWDELDHKLLRISVAVVSFAVAALFWFYVFRAFSPFKF
ncbi:MAG: hypothetical protein HYW26_03325 [Candidatus Aenigmarchaeota archaeon]|nr:hypothetical protein [Candidatus Aenigmarchaeota archaeon]